MLFIMASFDFLPTEQVLFFDTSALSLLDFNGAHSFFKRPDIHSEDFYEESAARTSCLIRKLSEMDNWQIISEVITELERDIATMQGFNAYKFKQLLAPNRACFQYLFQKKQLLNLIKQTHRNASANLTDEYKAEITRVLPEVEEIFKAKNGKTNFLNTDCRVVATALTFARDMEIVLFSHYVVLTDTFMEYAKNHPELKDVYAVLEKYKQTVPCRDYLMRVPSVAVAS